LLSLPGFKTRSLISAELSVNTTSSLHAQKVNWVDAKRHRFWKPCVSNIRTLPYLVLMESTAPNSWPVAYREGGLGGSMPAPPPQPPTPPRGTPLFQTILAMATGVRLTHLHQWHNINLNTVSISVQASQRTQFVNIIKTNE
jgi:hypothetical protein